MKKAIVAAAGVFAAVRFYQLKQDADRVEILVRSAIHSIKLNGVTVRLNVTLKNPTDSDFRFTFPFVKLMNQSSGQMLASSQAENSTVELPAGGETQLKPIMLNFPFTQLILLGLDFFKSFKEGKSGLQVRVETSSYALFFFDAIKKRVNWSSEITLQKKQTDE